MKLFGNRNCPECDGVQDVLNNSGTEILKCSTCNGVGHLKPHGILGGLRRGLVAFDLDGTLLNTSRALKEAYAHAGVTWVPNTPWQEFCTPEQHAAKCSVYPVHLATLGYKLTCFSYASKYSAPVVTSASASAVLAIQALFIGLIIHSTSHSTQTKAEAIKTLRVQLYVDDDTSAAADIAAASGVDVVTPDRFLELVSKEEMPRPRSRSSRFLPDAPKGL